jgi:hypothetical protein
MCCPGDENILRGEQQDTKNDDEYDNPAATSIGLVNSNADSGVSTSLPSAIDTMKAISHDTTSSLKHPSQRPPKSANYLENEYLENIAALTDRDEADWIEAVTLLKIDRLLDALYQAEQRIIAIIDEYYASICEDQARREAIRITEREEERKRAAIFEEQMQRWRDTQRLYVKKYMMNKYKHNAIKSTLCCNQLVTQCSPQIFVTRHQSYWTLKPTNQSFQQYKHIRTTRAFQKYSNWTKLIK